LFYLPSACASLYLHSFFTYQGLQADDETEVFLGKFTFDVQKSEIQTFHLQVCLFLGLKVLRQWGFERQLVRAALGDQFFA
jgi:hypothetical protein